jgi:hypothetical protein
MDDMEGKPLILVSFDVDGTLEVGDPPGPLPMELVRYAKRIGYVGSSSDRTLSEQRSIWQNHDIEVDFVGHKHTMHQVRERFDCARHIHIGDTEIDRHYAVLAGFEFWWAHEFPVDGIPEPPV